MLIIKGISPTSLAATDVEDIWQGRPNMLTKRFGLAAAVVNGRIYVIGGGNDEDGLLSTVEEYNPANGIWRTRTDMLTPRNRLAVAVVNEKIYAIGGWDGSNVSAIATVEEYDPKTNQWTTKTPMLTPRRSLTAAAVGGGSTLLVAGMKQIFLRQWRNTIQQPTHGAYGPICRPHESVLPRQ